jgi:IS30 family transposase
MSQLTDFERGRIIGHWESGESTCGIADALNHSQSQVARAIKAFKEEDRTTIAPLKNINELVFYLMNEWVVIICKN